MFNLEGPQGQNPRTTCGTRNTTDTSAVVYWYAAVIEVL